MLRGRPHEGRPFLRVYLETTLNGRLDGQTVSIAPRQAATPDE